MSICCPPHLVDIISDSLASSIFPTSLKTLVIRSILKETGLDKNNLNNYRPISQFYYIYIYILANDIGTIIVFLSAAFDTLNHSILINRFLMQVLQVRLWISSRNTVFPKFKHSQISLTYIAPLFAIIDTFPNISFHSYADDIQIYIRASNLNQLFTISRMFR